MPGSGLGTGILPDLIEKAGNSLRGGFRVTGGESRGGEPRSVREENSQLSYLLLCCLRQVSEAGCHIHQALLESCH